MLHDRSEKSRPGIDTSCMRNATGDVGPRARVQLLRDPFQRHRCLGSQAFGNRDFAPVPVGLLTFGLPS